MASVHRTSDMPNSHHLLRIDWVPHESCILPYILSQLIFTASEFRIPKVWEINTYIDILVCIKQSLDFRRGWELEVDTECDEVTHLSLMKRVQRKVRLFREDVRNVRENLNICLALTTLHCWSSSSMLLQKKYYGLDVPPTWRGGRGSFCFRRHQRESSSTEEGAEKC
jgi:hypothetical protein